MYQQEFAICIESDSHVGYVQPRSVGGDGYDIAVFNPRETIGGKFGFGKIVNFLAGQGLFNLLHFGYVLRRICQLLVELGVGRHVGDGQPFGVGTHGARYILKEAVAYAIVYPVGNIMQAGSVPVDFTVTVTDFLQVIGESAFRDVSVGQFGGECLCQHIFHQRGAVYLIAVDDEFFGTISLQRMGYVWHIQILYSIAQHIFPSLGRNGSYHGCGAEGAEHKFSHCFHFSFF